ncbi:hypothetical protein M231_05414 [Tremella mesenterica]|uniref:Phosphoglycerate mutase n=1 Tax=Tremella mesenterica TaxID=5217 RepID=A0A4Q1BI24_TREME|nr:hypothetical protein M231_05414 [Tremella mesenterica]
MLLYLVRHGKTDFNNDGLVQGQLDVPLNEEGRGQAKRLAESLRMVPVREIWTSDLKRAEETARAVWEFHPRASLNFDPRLRGRSYGALQGRKWEDRDNIPHLSESEKQIDARLHFWLSTLVQTKTPLTSPLSTPRTPLSPNDPGAGVIIAVTHEECLLSLLRILCRGQARNINNSLTIHPDNIDNSLMETVEKADKMEKNESPPESPIEVLIPPGVDTSLKCGNTAVAIVRVWWTDNGQGTMVPQGRLEAWGADEHLPKEDDERGYFDQGHYVEDE